MNDFTKQELKLLAASIPYLLHLETKERTELLIKVDKMIENYGSLYNKEIAKSNLEQAENLISHARCLLGMDDE